MKPEKDERKQKDTSNNKRIGSLEIDSKTQGIIGFSKKAENAYWNYLAFSQS